MRFESVFGYLLAVAGLVGLVWVFCVVDGKLDLFRLIAFVVVLGFIDEVQINWNWKRKKRGMCDEED